MEERLLACDVSHIKMFSVFNKNYEYNIGLCHRLCMQRRRAGADFLSTNGNGKASYFSRFNH